MTQSLLYLQTFWEYEYSAHITCALIFALLYVCYYAKFANAHFLIKGKYDSKKKNIGRPPPPYPNGWYNVTRADQLKPGNVIPIDIAGQNIALYRGKDKQVYALEAYCLHMGSHMGVNGQVINDACLQCPFHGWLYDGKTGHCVDYDGKPLQLKSVEYNSELCTPGGKIEWKVGGLEKPKLRKYPVSEVNGYIYIWIHAMTEHQEQPIYPMVNVQGFLQGLDYRGNTEHHIQCHIQDIPQNGADILHFKYVHTYITPAIPSIFFNWQAKWMRGDDPDLLSLFEHKKSQMREFKQRVYKQLIEPFPRKEFLSIGSLQNYIIFPILGECFMFSATIIQVGLPIVFIVLKSPLYSLVFQHYIRPQGRASQIVFHDCYISPWIPYFMSSIISQLQGGQVTNDMYIWESKKFARKAFLHENRDSDVYIKGWRTWASQHYQGCEYQQNKDKLAW